MTGAAFFDTNVILYTTSADAAKAERAYQLLERGGAVSVQVLNEIVRVLRGKNRLSWEAVDVILTGVRAACSIHPMTITTHDVARRLSERYQLRIYDACILAAAQLAGCDTLWSEDLQHGQVVDGVTIRNPFV